MLVGTKATPSEEPSSRTAQDGPAQYETILISNSFIQEDSSGDNTYRDGKVHLPLISPNISQKKMDNGGLKSEYFTIKEYFEQEMSNNQRQPPYTNNGSQRDTMSANASPLVKRPFSNCVGGTGNDNSGKQKSRPISCVSKNAKLPACFLEDYSNSAVKIRNQSASHQRIHQRTFIQQTTPHELPKKSRNIQSNCQLPQSSLSPFGTLQQDQQMNSISHDMAPPIPKPPQRRIQSSNLQYRKPVVNKRFMQKIFNNEVSN